MLPQAYLPDLSAYFNRFNISAEFYATQWCGLNSRASNYELHSSFGSLSEQESLKNRLPGFESTSLAIES